ncbi:hypothetical protein CQW23_27011 [Capsicum baccatum]|uniref:Disease resistance N-terminal domain-containing protein n=1 Tax=Capsicum baccatum TaxID=33114 RepID=A0A2G2VQG8_CAPBA|nr:hypothetical protein CQW23_27011 [Capsicum baccatum]
MEFEFIALDKAGEEAEWLQNFLEDIPYWPKPVAPVCIHCDSQAAIGRAGSMMYNEVSIIMTVSGGGDCDVNLVDGSFGDELVGTRNWSIVVDDDGAVGIGVSVGVAVAVDIIRIMEVVGFVAAHNSEMEIGLAVGRAFLSLALNVLFDRLAPHGDLLKMFQRHKHDDGLLEKLEDILLGLQIVLSDAENKQASDQRVRKWLNKLQRAVYGAENLLE